MPEPFKFEARLRSFGYALAGLRILFKEQHNAQIHLGVTVAVIGAGAWFQVSALEWCVLMLAIGGVFAAEALNTAIEYLADATVPDHNPLIAKAKDVAAAGVLLMSIAAAVAGLLVFVPLLGGDGA